MVKSVGVIGTFAVCVGFLIARQDASDVAKKKEATVRAVIAACKVDKLGEQMLDQMGTLLKDAVGSAFWKKFRDESRPELVPTPIADLHSRRRSPAVLAFSRPSASGWSGQPLLVKSRNGAEWGRKRRRRRKESEEEDKKDGVDEGIRGGDGHRVRVDQTAIPLDLFGFDRSGRCDPRD